MWGWLRATFISLEALLSSVIGLAFFLYERPFAVIGKNLHEVKGIGSLALLAVVVAAVGGGFKVMKEITSEPGDPKRPLQKWDKFPDLKRRFFLGFLGVVFGCLTIVVLSFVEGLMPPAWIGFVAVVAAVWAMAAGVTVVWGYLGLKSILAGAREG